MDWFQPMDEYCERIDASFWSEPLNALSNAAFILAALLLYVRWRGSRPGGRLAPLLILNVFMVGVGSFLYHTFANRWSVLADVIPITVFILFYLVVSLHVFLRLRWWQSLLAVIAFFAASQLVTPRLETVIGYTAAYVPALAAIFGVGYAAAIRGNAIISNGLFAAGFVFLSSMVFRAADLPLCASLPYGTHMIWHVLNAATLYLLVKLFMRVSAAPAAR